MNIKTYKYLFSEKYEQEHIHDLIRAFTIAGLHYVYDNSRKLIHVFDEVVGVKHDV
jgi:hypothetical protein